MTGDTDKAAVAARLRQARIDAGFRTAKSFADLVGVPQPTYAMQETGVNGLRRDVAQRYADALGIDAGWLMYGSGTTGPAIRVVGSVKAGHWSEAYEWPEEDQFTTFAPDFPEYRGRTRYGLRVDGDSMDRIYPTGTILDVVEPHRDDIRPKRRVIAMREATDGLVEATVKELAVGLDGQWLLYPRSKNPEHQAPVVWDPEDTNTVRVVAVVIGSYHYEPLPDSSEY